MEEERDREGDVLVTPHALNLTKASSSLNTNAGKLLSVIATTVPH
jgi:hypothetical protein